MLTENDILNIWLRNRDNEDVNLLINEIEELTRRAKDTRTIDVEECYLTE